MMRDEVVRGELRRDGLIKTFPSLLPSPRGSPLVSVRQPEILTAQIPSSSSLCGYGLTLTHESDLYAPPLLSGSASAWI